jgi:hypothetical protein
MEAKGWAQHSMVNHEPGGQWRLLSRTVNCQLSPVCCRQLFASGNCHLSVVRTVTVNCSAAAGNTSVLAGTQGIASWADGGPGSNPLLHPRALCQDSNNPDHLFFLDQGGRVVQLLDLATGGLPDP